MQILLSIIMIVLQRILIDKCHTVRTERVDNKAFSNYVIYGVYTMRVYRASHAQSTSCFIVIDFDDMHTWADRLFHNTSIKILKSMLSDDALSLGLRHDDAFRLAFLIALLLIKVAMPTGLTTRARIIFLMMGRLSL